MPRDPELQRMRAAADWLIRLQDAPDDEALVSDWLQWCEEDPKNLQEFRSAQSVWHAAVPAPTAARVQAESPARPTRSFSSLRRGWAPARAVTALAATLVLMVGVGFAVLTHRMDSSTSQTYATAIGGAGSTVLPDGSRVDLGADSRITTFYTDEQRGVSVDSGEAYFRVARDAERPFLVAAGDMQVTAVGTAFNVRRHPGRVVVAVSEGKVKLDNNERRRGSGEPHDLAATPLNAGQQAVYDGKSGSIAIAAVQLEDVASWRRGLLKYVHEPLGNVVLDLSRYHSKRIVISDATLSEMPFTGTIFSERIADALSALENSFPLQVREYSDRIELSPRG